MADAKSILLSIYNQPDRGKGKKDLWFKILKDLPFGTTTGSASVVTWGTPGAEAGNKIETELQLTDPSGDAWDETTILRLTCTSPGTMSLGAGAKGTVVSGDDTDDMIIETDATGAFSLEVTDTSTVLVGDIYVLGGSTQGSPALDARTSLTNTFA